jgi:hypothetical protein
MCGKCLPENLTGRDDLENLGVDKRIIFKWLSKNLCVIVRAGLIWLSIGTRGGLL